jgi:DNA-binding NarL/FixJ family response regulator
VSGVLILDDQVLTTEALGFRVRERLGVEPVLLHRVADLTPALITSSKFDLAVVDLSYRDEVMHGLDALYALHRWSPDTALVIHTVGDSNVEAMLRDAWELLPVATAITKGPSAAGIVDVLEVVMRNGEAPLDPVLQPLLPAVRQRRDPASFERLVPHKGHAKMWRALAEEPEGASYSDLASAAGVKINAIKNYRADVIGELEHHRLTNPTTRQMQEFAKRARPFLRPYLRKCGVTVIGID